MSKYAIIELSGKQYKISVGDQIIVDRLEGEADQEIVNDRVLLVQDGEQVKIGLPYVAGAKVTLKLLKQQLAKKIRVAKFKAKSRYRRVRGHRQPQSVVEITKIA